MCMGSDTKRLAVMCVNMFCNLMNGVIRISFCVFTAKSGNTGEVKHSYWHYVF